MTPDEKRMLSELADKFAKTPSPPKDPEAEDFIRTRIGNRPDALYLMTQTVLIQNLALDQAQRQIQELQQRQGAGAGSSFLGQQAPQPAQQTYGSPQPQYAPPSQQYASAPSGGSSFLRGAAQTAAGVAAGALAFEGIRSLFGGGMGYGHGFGGYGGGSPVEETVVNNYYDSPDRGTEHGTGDDLQLHDNRDSFVSSDDAQYQDASFDDNSGFDSGDGGFDSGFDSGDGGGDDFV